MRCKYIRKIFQNEENGYTVALFSTLDHEVPLSARDKFWADKKIIAFTAKGYDLPLTDEIEIEMEGEWETNSHGTQYKVETFLEVVPRTREGILGYLAFQCEIPKWSIIRESGTCHRKSGRRTDLFNRRCIKRYDSPLFIWRYVHLRCRCQSVQKFKASFGNTEKQASAAPI